MPRKFYNKKVFKKKRSKFAVKFRPRNMTSLIKRTILKMGEKKYVDGTGANNVSILGAMVDLGLAGIPVGDTQNDRTGIKIRLINFHMRYECFIPAGSTDTSNTLRCVIFQWYDSAAPLGQQVLFNVALGSFTVNSSYNKENAMKFRVLYDKRIYLSLEGTRNVAGKINMYGNKIPLKDIIYLNASIPKGQYFMLLVSDSAAVAHPTFTYEHRFSFYDA